MTTTGEDQVANEFDDRWSPPKPRTEEWWLVQPATAGRTCTNGGLRRQRTSEGWRRSEKQPSRGRQVPSQVGYEGCRKCGAHGHRAVECDEAVADWLKTSMVDRGPVLTKMRMAQMIAEAEAASQQERLAKEAGLQRQFEEERRSEKAKRKQEKREKNLKYAEQRKVRQAKLAARRQRQKAKAALEAAARGEYPMPWASREEAKADIKEAEAKRREAARRERFAGWTHQQRHQQRLQAEAERDKQQAEQRKVEAQRQATKQAKQAKRERDKQAQQQFAQWQQEAQLQYERWQQQQQDVHIQRHEESNGPRESRPWAELDRQAAAAKAVADAAKARRNKKAGKQGGLCPLNPFVDMNDDNNV